MNRDRLVIEELKKIPVWVVFMHYDTFQYIQITNLLKKHGIKTIYQLKKWIDEDGKIKRLPFDGKRYDDLVRTLDEFLVDFYHATNEEKKEYIRPDLLRF